MRERAVDKYLREQVEKIGGLCEKFVSPGRRGVPDRIVLWPEGSIDFIETKAPDGQLEDAQVRDHKRRRELGFSVHVLRNREDVDAYIANQLRLGFLDSL